MAIMDITVIPTGKTSVSDIVAEILKVIRESGLKHELTAMGTIVEGEIDELLRLAGRAHSVPFDMGVQRVVTIIKIDDRKDKPNTIERKVKAVMDKL